MSNVRD